MEEFLNIDFLLFYCDLLGITIQSDASYLRLWSELGWNQ